VIGRTDRDVSQNIHELIGQEDISVIHKDGR
jgi:hypothetical protein